MGVGKRMYVDRAVGKRPVRVPRPFSGCFEEISIERDILRSERALLKLFAPSEQCMHQLPFSLLFWICDLFPCEATHCERLVHNVRALPHAAFFVESPLRISKIDRTDAH